MLDESLGSTLSQCKEKALRPLKTAMDSLLANEPTSVTQLQELQLQLLAATNKALEDTHNLLIWWDSLSLVQRKMPTAKLRCATVMEGSVLNLCSSRTGVPPTLPSQGGEDEGGEGE